MSHTEHNTYGLEHGKIGDRVAVVLNGKQIYKKLYKPSNPKTAKQQMHRAKLAFLNRLSAHLADAVNLGFELVPQPASMQTPRNAFVKANWDNGSTQWDDERGEWLLRPEKLELAQGPRFIAHDMRASVEGNLLHVSCPTSGMEERHGVADDQLIVAAYFPALDSCCLYAGPMREDCGESVFELPAEAFAEEGRMLVYAWFRSSRYHRFGGGKATVHPGQSSASVYLGEHTVPAR